MLVQQSRYNIGDIINLKLVSGDEVCGQLIGTDGREYELRCPCIVVTTPEGVGLLRAMFGHDPDFENIRYRDQHIISMCKTHQKMAEHWQAVTREEEPVITVDTPQ